MRWLDLAFRGLVLPSFLFASARSLVKHTRLLWNELMEGGSPRW